jgi:hypothetical protein
MVHVTSAVTTHDLAYGDATPRKRTTARDLFNRVMDVIIAARRRQVEREIGRFLRDNGGKLTDDVERTIERRFLTTL